MRRAIFLIAAVLGAVVIIGCIMLDRAPSNPLSCAHILIHVDYVRPPANDRERDAHEKTHYTDVGFGCP